MKTAFVYDAVYPYVKGGAEKRVYELGKRLSERGHEVHWFGVKWWDGEDVIERDGIILHGVCRPMPLYTKTGRRSIKEALWFSLKLIRSLSKERFDLIDCQQFPYLPCFSAKLISSLKKTPLIITWHEVWGDYWYQYLGWKGFFGKIIERICSQLTNNNVAVSEKTRDMFLKLGVRGEHISVVPNGIDLERIQEIKPSGEEFDVLFVGRLIKEKNVDILIESIKEVSKEVPEIKAGIIGEGPEGEELKSLTKHLDLEDNIKFLGFLPDYDDVISYMKSSKVFVLPSTREGFGIVALEANACGTPVVTVNCESNATCEFITDENGFICELSEDDVAEKILMALDKGDSMRGGCIENAKRYNWNELGDSLEWLYEVEFD